MLIPHPYPKETGVLTVEEAIRAFDIRLKINNASLRERKTARVSIFSPLNKSRSILIHIYCETMARVK